MSTNIKYNSNKNQRLEEFFKNAESFLVLNDRLKQSGYVALDVNKSLIIDEEEMFDPLRFDKFVNKKTWKFGFLGYDLKNDFEVLSSNNKDNLSLPKLYFFVPKTLIKFQNDKVELVYGNENDLSIAHLLLGSEKDGFEINNSLQSSITKEAYLEKVERLKNEIKKGNIYEANFCYEYFAENALVNPYWLYQSLMENSNAPFSCFGKFEDKYIISASPERFLIRKGNKLISEPIKGTAKRGRDKQEDFAIKTALRENEKERAENIMIVDLVRNDFSRIANYNSVKVEELCKIYSFKTVHQMISKVSCELKEGIQFSEILKATFPMGSMTGAPKISAMELIEREEETKRGLYSGAVGYIKPNGDFDFNVVIRSFIYNATAKYLSAMVGGAITAKSNPEEEYEETLVKIAALFKSLA